MTRHDICDTIVNVILNVKRFISGMHAKHALLILTHIIFPS